MSSVVISGDTSGAVTLSAPAVAGTVTVTLPSVSGTMLQSGTTVTEAQGGTGTTTGYYGFKNRIINGAMVIDQRNAGAAVTGASSFPVDRFFMRSVNDGAYSGQQDSSAPAGFTKSTKITVTTADSSLTTTQSLSIRQRVEGFNISDFGWGAAGAATVTLSFWVRSSVTGTYGGSICNGNEDRSYPFTFAISSANTWEQKSVTIAGDTSGTWAIDNSTGLNVFFSVGAGPTYSGTAGAWSGNTYYSATGAINMMATLNATFYITGVQLEKGSTATSFDYRPYGTELALCQRYLPAWSGTSGNQDFCSAFNNTTTGTAYVLTHPMQTRVPPTGVTATGTFLLFASNNAYTVTSLTFGGSSTGATRVSGTITAGTAGAGGSGAGQGTWNLYLTGCEL